MANNPRKWVRASSRLDINITKKKQTHKVTVNFSITTTTSQTHTHNINNNKNTDLIDRPHTHTIFSLYWIYIFRYICISQKYTQKQYLADKAPFPPVIYPFLSPPSFTGLLIINYMKTPHTKTRNLRLNHHNIYIYFNWCVIFVCVATKKYYESKYYRMRIYKTCVYMWKGKYIHTHTHTQCRGSEWNNNNYYYKNNIIAQKNVYDSKCAIQWIKIIYHVFYGEN